MTPDNQLPTPLLVIKASVILGAALVVLFLIGIVAYIMIVGALG